MSSIIDTKTKANNFLERASKATIEDCLRLTEDDKLVIVTDNKAYRVADELAKAASEKTKDISSYIVEDYGTRPLKHLPEEIAAAMGHATASIFVAAGLQEELGDFRYPFLDLIRRYKIRHAHMPDMNVENMRHMLTKPEEIKEYSARLYSKLEGYEHLRIETTKGTNLTTERGSGFRWHISYGIIRPGEWENLPSGEIFTCPVRVSGEVVVDGTLGQGFDIKYGILKTPLRFKIENSRVKQGSVECECENKELEQEFVNYIFNIDEESSKVAELAFGTNPGVRRLIGRLLIDEKCIGTSHIALGNPPDPEKIGGGAWWQSKGHIDCVIKKINLYVDDKQVLKDGKLLDDNI